MAMAAARCSRSGGRMAYCAAAGGASLGGALAGALGWQAAVAHCAGPEPVPAGEYVGAILIPRPEEFARKRQALIAGGRGSLAVISDFDRTITSAFVGRKRGASCYGVADGGLTPEIQAAKQKLFDHYYPIEKSAELTASAALSTPCGRAVGWLLIAALRLPLLPSQPAALSHGYPLPLLPSSTAVLAVRHSACASSSTSAELESAGP